MEKVSHKNMTLDGVWQISYNKIGEATYEEGKKKSGIPCKVPGDVHMALMDAGIIKDPANGLASKECKWMEEMEYWYQKEFVIEEEFVQDKMELVLEGLDLTADVWINDCFLGRSENAFVEARYNVTEFIKCGKNTIVVRIDQGLESVKDKPIEDMDQMWNHDQPYRSWMRKPQYVYGWDWTIWLPSCGIWKSVTLHSMKEAHVKNLYIYEEFLEKVTENADFVVKLDVELEQVFSSEQRVGYFVEWVCYTDERFEDKRKIFSEKTKVVKGMNQVQSMIQNGKLWWSNGTGNPYLYHMEVRLYNETDELLDEITLLHGIRKIEIQEIPLNDQEKSFTFVLNEEPVFCKGANHVPMDCLPGRVTEDKTIQLMVMAKEANMNMIRVWGGGIYESDTFFEQCDKLGLMVWHDFMFACGYHPDTDQDYMDNVKREAILAVERIRNHASLIGFSGNNEIQEMYIATVSWKKDLPWYGGKIYEKLLPEIVKSYTKNMIYRESSPYGDPKDPAGFDIGDQHIWHFTHRPQYEHFMDLWRYTDFNLKFLSEFGIIGTMNINSTKKCISESEQNPDSEEWLFHSNNSSDHQLLNMVMQTYFGEYKQFSMEEYIVRSQMLQAEITRHIYDEFQRRKFVCSGLLFWTIGDSIGIHNWSLIDYYMEKKPVYDYLKRSMNPLKTMIKGYEVQNFHGRKNYKEYFAKTNENLEIWIGNDYLQDQSVTITYQIMDVSGKIEMENTLEVLAPKNAAKQVCNISLSQLISSPEDMFLYVKTEQNGDLIHENRYFFAPYDQIAIKEGTIECHLKKIDNHKYELTMKASTFIWMLHMETDKNVTMTDNNFDLMKGQEKKIVLSGEDLEETDIHYYAMNSLQIKNV